MATGTVIYSSLACPRPRHPPLMLSRYSCYLAPPTPPHELDAHRPRPTVISTFSPQLRTPSPPSYPTTGSNVLMGRSSLQLFISTRSRVIRIFNLPKDASCHLASLFHPATSHTPLTLWALREEYRRSAPGDEDSVWAVFKSHEQALAALGLSGGTVSVATALEADLEPFQKLRKLELRRHSIPALTTPQPPSHLHHPGARPSNNSQSASSSPISPLGPSHPHVTDLARLGLPLRTSHSVSDLRARGLDLHTTEREEYGFTLSSNPPNPRNTFRQGDWICASPNCAAHNFMRNLVCIGCGSSRPIAGPSPSASNPQTSSPWPRVASSPRFCGVPPSEFISGVPQSSDLISSRCSSDLTDPRATYIPPSPLSAVPPQRSLPKMPSLPSFSSGSSTTPNGSFSPPGHSFSPSGHSHPSDPLFSPSSHSFSPASSFSPPNSSPTRSSFSPTSFSFSPSTTTFSPTSTSFPLSSPSSTINVATAAVALKLPSILTPTGRAFSIGGKVQNVSSDPLAPCVLYWPDNEPFPEQGQIRPPGNVGSQPPPILNTGNKGPIEQQPGDWVCRKCDYLNWRRRKVCQTCFPYAEGNTDGVSASVQAERISMLAQVLAASHPQSQSHGTQLVPAQPQSSQLVHTAQSHSIPTPPNDTLDYIYRSSPSDALNYPMPHPSSPSLYAIPHSPPHYPDTNSSASYVRAVSSSPESEYFPTPSWRGPLLPSFLHEEDNYASDTPGPATPPLSVSSGSSSPQSVHGPTLRNSSSSSSLSFAGGSSIWALRKEEVDK